MACILKSLRWRGLIDLTKSPQPSLCYKIRQCAYVRFCSPFQPKTVCVSARKCASVFVCVRVGGCVSVYVFETQSVHMHK